ncbi:hypothetical protein AB0F17_46050 [Nonomuraea sp. NPDC026600]|uniref:hypothetical protein n=1 Tax=Nonomuraea sp. NPDC026600 TaxID=3155363 RepID=UPI0033DC2822
MTRLWYLIGLLLIVSGLVHLGVFVVDGGPWDGPVSWRKPFTFGVSFGLSVLSLTWVAQFVRLRGRDVLLGVFAVASVVEVALITVQAWRGVPSHFNMSTDVDSLIARTLAAGGFALIAVAVFMTVSAFRRDPTVPTISASPQAGLGASPSMRLAVQAGFGTFLAAMAFGGIMIARGVVEVITGSQQFAYTVAGSLKPAHAILMHGVLLLPALAWLLSRTQPSEQTRLRVVRLAIWTYITISAIVSGLALFGITIVSPSTASVLCAGAISGLAIGALTLGTLLPRTQRHAADQSPGPIATCAPSPPQGCARVPAVVEPGQPLEDVVRRLMPADQYGDQHGHQVERQHRQARAPGPLGGMPALVQDELVVERVAPGQHDVPDGEGPGDGEAIAVAEREDEAVGPVLPRGTA